MAEEPLLDVSELHTRFDTPDGVVHAVDGVSFSVHEGEVLGVVGESGSGKSVTALSCMGLEEPGEIVEGSVRFRGTELTDADEATLRRVRARDMAMVFQAPSTTLNPVFRVSDQIAESLKVQEDPDTQRLREHLALPVVGDRRGWAAHRRRAVDLMDEVGIPNPGERVDAYPHEFSGGMRQRAMLAIALARRPDLLIADEPTTALDVTIQAQILDLLSELAAERGMAVVLITHDMGVISELCDRVVVLYGGEVMETGSVERILTEPRHPYTRKLLECMPQTAHRGSELAVIEGQVPDLVGGHDGCVFAPRCEHATAACRGGEMPVVSTGEDHRAKCCRIHELDAHDGGEGP